MFASKTGSQNYIVAAKSPSLISLSKLQPKQSTINHHNPPCQIPPRIRKKQGYHFFDVQFLILVLGIKGRLDSKTARLHPLALWIWQSKMENHQKHRVRSMIFHGKTAISRGFLHIVPTFSHGFPKKTPYFGGWHQVGPKGHAQGSASAAINFSVSSFFWSSSSFLKIELSWKMDEDFLKHGEFSPAKIRIVL